jgi:hypothetical protein
MAAMRPCRVAELSNRVTSSYGILKICAVTDFNKEVICVCVCVCVCVCKTWIETWRQSEICLLNFLLGGNNNEREIQSGDGSKTSYKVCIKMPLQLAYVNVATRRNVWVMYEKCDIEESCTSKHYA